MPEYNYICLCGHRFEAFLPISQYTEAQFCSNCGLIAKKIITSPSAVHGEESSWIRDTNAVLTSKFDKPITNRTEWKQRLREKGLNPVG